MSNELLEELDITIEGNIMNWSHALLLVITLVDPVGQSLLQARVKRPRRNLNNLLLCIISAIISF